MQLEPYIDVQVYVILLSEGPALALHSPGTAELESGKRPNERHGRLLEHDSTVRTIIYLFELGRAAAAQAPQLAPGAVLFVGEVQTVHAYALDWSSGALA